MVTRMTTTTVRETHPLPFDAEWFIAIGQYASTGKWFVARGHRSTYLPIAGPFATEAKARAEANAQWLTDAKAMR